MAKFKIDFPRRASSGTKPQAHAVSPLIATMIAASFAVLGTALGAYLQGRANLELERQKLESSLILKAIETGDPAISAKNLEFLASAGLISLGREQLDKLKQNPEKSPVLPSAEGRSIVPLRTTAARQEILGRFRWEPDPKIPSAIHILDNWVQENIVTIEIPQLRSVPGAKPYGRVRFHKAFAENLRGAFAEIEERGLLDRVLSWDGSFAPRLVRGSKTTLSNHSFGTAFDINVQWHSFSRRPPQAGEEGSVVELVPIFEKHGFFWGGYFARVDGGHFEVGVTAADASSEN